jgi:hypothetical protein
MAQIDYHDPYQLALSEATATLERLGEDPTLSTAALERYARAEADAALVRARWEARQRPVSGTGSMGQAVPSHFLEIIRRTEREAADYGDRLGLTPAARKAIARKVGRPLGSTTAPDRGQQIRRIK